MQSTAALILAALAAAVQAVQFDFSNGGFSPEAGVPITLNWSGAEGPVTITLKNGPSDDLKTVEVLTSGETDGTFTWTPSTDLPSDTYALEISDSTGANYSPQFELEGDGTASTSSATPSPTESSVSSTTESSTSMITSTSSISNTTMTSSTTMTTKTTSKDETTTAEETDSPTTTPVNQNGSQRLASSLALVIGAVAAFVAFN